MLSKQHEEEQLVRKDPKKRRSADSSAGSSKKLATSRSPIVVTSNMEDLTEIDQNMEDWSEIDQILEEHVNSGKMEDEESAQIQVSAQPPASGLDYDLEMILAEKPLSSESASSDIQQRIHELIQRLESEIHTKEARKIRAKRAEEISTKIVEEMYRFNDIPKLPHTARVIRYLRGKGHSEQTVKRMVMTALVSLYYVDKTRQSKNILIFGSVQLGKTIDQQLVMAIAYDAGCKAIFLISGKNNTLRSQTEARMLEAFPMLTEEHGVIRLTFKNKDIHGLTLELLETQDLDSDKPLLAVIKKNRRAMDLCRWMLTGQWDGKGQPTKKQQKLCGKLSKYCSSKAMILDEECDDGTQNFSRNSEAGSAIFEGVCALKNCFDVAHYLGWSATPYSVLLQVFYLFRMLPQLAIGS